MARFSLVLFISIFGGIMAREKFDAIVHVVFSGLLGDERHLCLLSRGCRHKIRLSGIMQFPSYDGCVWRWFGSTVDSDKISCFGEFVRGTHLETRINKIETTDSVFEFALSQLSLIADVDKVVFEKPVTVSFNNIAILPLSLIEEELQDFFLFLPQEDGKPISGLIAKTIGFFHDRSNDTSEPFIWIGNVIVHNQARLAYAIVHKSGLALLRVVRQ